MRLKRCRKPRTRAVSGIARQRAKPTATTLSIAATVWKYRRRLPRCIPLHDKGLQAYLSTKAWRRTNRKNSPKTLNLGAYMTPHGNMLFIIRLLTITSLGTARRPSGGRSRRRLVRQQDVRSRTTQALADGQRRGRRLQSTTRALVFRRFNSTFYQTIESLARTLDKMDHYTSGSLGPCGPLHGNV